VSTPAGHGRRRRSSTPRRILVCCGSGGVGKTTTAARWRCGRAERGRRTGGAHDRPRRAGSAQSMGPVRADNTPRTVARRRTPPRAARSTR
jgi:Mrp family chromosome partitioning ATPase